MAMLLLQTGSRSAVKERSSEQAYKKQKALTAFAISAFSDRGS